MKKIAYFSLLIFFLSSCSHKANSDIFSFNTSENVTSTTLLLDTSVIMNYPYRITKNDSLLFILDLSAPENFVHLFSYPELKHYKSFCRRGNGPEEFVSVSNIQLDADSLYVYNTQNKIYVYSLPSLLSIDATYSRKIELPTEYGFLLGGIRQNEKFYFPSFSGIVNNKILEFDKNGKFLSAFGELNLIDKTSPVEPVTYIAWSSVLGGNGNILATGTQHGNVIDIYTDKDQATIRGKEGDPIFKDAGGYPAHEGISGFSDIVVKDEYIYALFNGRELKDEHEKEQGGDKIYIFDRKGKPIKEMILDKRFVSIYIDENNTIFGLDVNINTPLSEIKY